MAEQFSSGTCGLVSCQPGNCQAFLLYNIKTINTITALPAAAAAETTTKAKL